jgi:hypothetical protein
MKPNSDKTQNKEQTCQYQKQLDSAIHDACEKYQQHRDKAEKQITQGARTTDHRIKL